MSYLTIAGSSACVYVFMVVAIRLFGKKEIAQLSIIDLVFILLISNAVQNAMVGPDTSLLGGICAAGTLFIINFALKYAIYRFPKFSAFVQGSPVMLVYEGAIIKENMIKSKISIYEIEEAAREHGVMSIDEINLAILEVDGNISILTDDYKTKIKGEKKG
jgi:uncharacterized membrane protein YcaP (DUF421 family)